MVPNLLAKVMLQSPNQKIVVSVDIAEKLEPYPAGKRLYYSIQYTGRNLLADSAFRLDFKDQPPLARNLVIRDEKRTSFREEWEFLWCKQRRILNHYNQLVLSLEESEAPKRRLDLTIRAFDDGVAFRYSLPAQPSLDEFRLVSELNEFRFVGNPTVWGANYGSFTTHQESEFAKTKLAALRSGDILGCPLLVEAGPAWVAVTEADLTDWAGLYLTGMPSGEGVVSLLSPRLDQPGVAVVSKTPRESPWRVVMIGERPVDLIASNIILNLNPPSRISDTSWIQPGLAAWDRWWCGSYAPDFEGSLGMSTESMKYFVDFSGEMGWKYQLVDWTWYGPPFDPGKPFGSAGNPKADLTRSIPELDVPALVKHAAAKGIRIFLWLDWFNADKQMERAFPVYESWGVAGVKVDFMARDDQETVNFYERLVRLAARHHLVVDFHGAYKPTGMQRTWPNQMTREGVMGNEYNKWSKRITPTHNVTLPFTRMLAGPMDFTPGGFRNKTVEQFRIVGGDAPGPFVMGTRCHQLAMNVVYESPLQVMTDSPYSYRVSPAGLDFLKVVPAAWDETRPIDGYPGEFVVLARRSGDEWYLGGMNGDQARTVEVNLDFLGGIKYRAETWTDAEEVADYPEHLWKKSRAVSAGDKLKIHMAAGGGFVARLAPEKP